MKIFKFGGGILHNAKAIRNLPEVLKPYLGTDLVIVISALGKVTNALEDFIRASFENKEEDAKEQFEKIREYHNTLLQDLFEDSSSQIFNYTQTLFRRLEETAKDISSVSFDEYYDRLIFYGEMLSSTIIHHFLKNSGLENNWLDARNLILTDSRFRNATVDFSGTASRIEKNLAPIIQKRRNGPGLVITQGFIGSDDNNRPTSLGREGSDYTASILGSLLDVDEVIIWKDVPGVLNADPKHFNDTVKLERLSYSEATELAYYGAKVMHHKTVKPLQNKQIPLWVKPYWEPEAQGTLIHAHTDQDSHVPSYIFKFDQVLISLSTRDLSFINEKVYHEVFGIVSRYNFHVNITQNSALTLSFCVDTRRSLPELLDELKKSYRVRYNEGLELITIRHYDAKSREKALKGRQVILEQQNRTVLQFVVK